MQFFKFLPFVAVLGIAPFVVAQTAPRPASAKDRPPQAGQTQRPAQTYYSVISVLPWDDSSGSVIAVCPLAVANGKTLKDLNRKLVPFGGVTAVVPTTMWTINSRFTDSPNLYDGLPETSKVLYLLTLLTEAQWNKITDEGLTLADCRGEQIPVMQSIIPNPLVVQTGRIEAANSISFPDKDAVKTFTDDERNQVKLQVSKHLELTVYIANNGGYSGASIRDSRKKGDSMAYIKEDDKSEYGQHVLTESTNTPKRSDLAYNNPRFATKVPLHSGESIKDLFARLAVATGVELYADPHYTHMQVFERGPDASAKDILQAVTLGIAGTFRRLGSAYILTCDLEGVAAHQARIAAWEDDLEKIVRDRESLWRGVIAKGNGMGKMRIADPAFQKFNAAEIANMAANDKGDQTSASIDPATAGDAVRLELSDYHGGLNIDKNKVSIFTSAQYTFILPDGSKPWNIRWLGQTNMFKPDQYMWQPKKVGPVDLPIAPPANLRAVVLQAGSDEEALDDVARVHKLGIGEVWIDAKSPSVLSTAVEAGKPLGVKVCAAIRPWVADRGDTTKDPDRTTAGDYGKSLQEKELAYRAFQNFWLDIQGFMPNARLQFSPMDPALSAHWSHLTAFAAVKGLSGVELLDAYPIGYANDNSYTSGDYFYSPAVDNFLSYGYSTCQRLAYFQATQIDPLDIEGEGPRTKASFREAWGEAWSSGQPFEKWQQTKGKWMHDAIQSLVSSIAATGAPVQLGGQHVKIHLPPYNRQLLYSWKPGNDLPVTPEDYRGEQAAKKADVQVIEFQDSQDLEQTNRVAANILNRFKEKKPIVIDFSSIPQRRLNNVLSGWFKK